MLLAGCGGAPKGEGGEGFSHRTADAGHRTADAGHRTTDAGHRSTPKPKRRRAGSRHRTSPDPTRRTSAGYRSTPDSGPARGLKFADVIPIGARITAVNVATDDGVRAIWLSYEREGVVSNTPRRGGAGGFTEVLELKGNEKLIGIDATGRNSIEELTVATDRRVWTIGHDGSSDKPPSWLSDKQKQQYVGIGITGRADDQLRQLSFRFQVRK